MGLKRRAFLRQTGLLLAALGLSEASLSLLTHQYQQALAQPTRRKLALLVGINQYPESVCDYVPRGSALSGCLTDVELQQELLIHRFGFRPEDILTLTDEAATRHGIEAAFMNHLVQQAKPEDVVLFHFSGLGSQIQIEGATGHQCSLVPINGMLPTVDDPVIHDLPETTLLLLLQSLPTEQVITVLDTGYTSVGRNLQGNLRIRSRPSMPIGALDEAERAFQEQLLHAHPTAAWKRPRLAEPDAESNPYPGILLQASTPNRIATEAQWNGFSAGLFTYALTQQLWWAAPATTLRISFNQASGIVKQVAGTEQQPVISDQRSQKLLPALTEPGGNADGVIHSIDEEGKVALWLAGLPAIVLENASASLFSIAEPAGSDHATATAEPQRPASQLLQARSREGLTVKARGLSADSVMALQPGKLVYEEVRILPRNIGLTIALDPSLKRIERVDATSAFSAIPRVSSVIAGEQPADFLFGKTQPQILAAALPLANLTNNLIAETAQDVPSSPESPAHPAQNSYGLFYLGRDAILNTLSQEAEAVKTSVNRMTPQLKALLAIKLLRLTQNQGSSRLGVRAALETISPQERLVLQQETMRAPGTAPTSKVATLLLSEGSPILTASSQIQYRLQNYSNRPVHFLLIGLDTKGNAVIFYPPKSEPSATSSIWAAIAPGETRIIPQISAANWLVQTSSGLTETYLIFSRAPFTQTFHALEAEVRSKVDIRPVAALLNPLEVVQAILQDLHQASSATVPSDIPADTYALDVNAWTTLSFVYQVVAS